MLSLTSPSMEQLLTGRVLAYGNSRTLRIENDEWLFIICNVHHHGRSLCCSKHINLGCQCNLPSSSILASSSLQRLGYILQTMGFPSGLKTCNHVRLAPLILALLLLLTVMLLPRLAPLQSCQTFQRRAQYHSVRLPVLFTVLCEVWRTHGM